MTMIDTKTLNGKEKVKEEEEGKEEGEVEEVNKTEKIWKSCCFNVDPEFATFMVAVISSFTLISFCIFQIMVMDKDGTGDRFAIYMSLLTGSVHVWIPSPIVNKKK